MSWLRKCALAALSITIALWILAGDPVGRGGVTAASDGSWAVPGGKACGTTLSDRDVTSTAIRRLPLLEQVTELAFKPRHFGSLQGVDRGSPDGSIVGLSWCCCGGCCGYAVNCRAIPGCPRC